MFFGDLQLVCFLLLAALILFVFFQVYRNPKNVSTIPGMQPSSKEEGNLSDIARAGSIHEFLSQLHATYGPIAAFWFGRVYTISIASPELFKQHAHASMRGRPLLRLFEPVFGSASLVYCNDEEGRARRKCYDRAFGHDRLCTLFEKFQKATDLVVEDWSRKGPDDHIPVCEDTFVFSVRSALFAILGEDFHDDALVYKFKKAYETAWGELERRVSDTVPPDPGSERMKQFNDAVQCMRGTVQRVVQQRQETTTQGTLLIDDLIEHAANEDILESDGISYLVGAFHTTANLLAWCFYFLATHEQVQERVYHEVKDILGDAALVDESNFDRFKFTRQVLDESLRCGVVAPWTPRAQETDCILAGHHIPKQTPVIHALGVVLQDNKLWPSPKTFDPERFSEENNNNRHPYAFSPFGFGAKRKCPAYKFSYLESTVLLTSILKRFKVTMQKEQTVNRVYGFVTHPDVEIWIKVIKRK